MCLVKTPKIKNPTSSETDKPLPILRNPLLDGIDPSTKALRVGRQSLRIDRNPASGPTAATTPSPSAGARFAPAGLPAMPLINPLAGLNGLRIGG